MINIVNYSGQMGSGKTLGMSLQALSWQAQSGCTLYSNYGLIGSKPFESFNDFLDVAQQPSSIVCLDEIHNDIDSRDFNTNSVKYFSHIAFYLRKLRCTLMISTPLFENVESRVRNVTNIVVPVYNDKNYYYYPFHDWQSNQYKKTKKIKKEKAHALAPHIYDTYAMVTPLEYPSSRDEFKNLLHQLKETNKLYLQAKQSEGLPQGKPGDSSELKELILV